jgi:hypothetical protein
MQRILVNRQRITQTAESRMIQVAYADNKVLQAILPKCDYQNVFRELWN